MVFLSILKYIDKEIILSYRVLKIVARRSPSNKEMPILSVSSSELYDSRLIEQYKRQRNLSIFTIAPHVIDDIFLLSTMYW